ncbi:MAG: hypothetical protein JXB46_10935 [Candidatus Eisenbacteria bacterium]|nr:hypothetical protein [Candidatus Eisenbacteria bacterium]
MRTGPASKLTLVVDSAVVRKAKSFAASHGTSVSGLVEAYLKQLTVAEEDGSGSDLQDLPPVTRSLYGALRPDESDVPDAEALKTRRLMRKHLHD